jgi:hypothetical protein
MLQDKTLSELRGIALSLGIKNIFSLDKLLLLQEIENNKNVALAKEIKQDINISVSNSNRKRLSEAQVKDILKPLLDLGLIINFEGDSWVMHKGIKEDSGSVFMPLRDVVRCAKNIMT